MRWPCALAPPAQAPTTPAWRWMARARSRQRKASSMASPTGIWGQARGQTEGTAVHGPEAARAGVPARLPAHRRPAPGRPLAAPAGAIMSTVTDLHDWYRVLFGAPERIGLTPGASQRGTLALQREPNCACRSPLAAPAKGPAAPPAAILLLSSLLPPALARVLSRHTGGAAGARGQHRWPGVGGARPGGGLARLGLLFCGRHAWLDLLPVHQAAGRAGQRRRLAG